MNLRFTLWAAVACLFLLVGPEMARAEEYLCSPMSGQLVTEDGTPVAGTAVRRHWYWRGKRGEDRTVTDDAGHFAFGAVSPKRGLFGRIPVREAVTQDFYAELPEGDFQFLYLSTRGLTLNAETEGKPFNIRCVTGIEPHADDIHFGTCTLIE
jgi:hypothetical protein